MQDEQIGEELRRRGLELVYLGELAAALGFGEEEGWTEAVFEAIEGASADQRRAAALRTLSLSDGEDPERGSCEP